MEQQPPIVEIFDDDDIEFRNPMDILDVGDEKQPPEVSDSIKNLVFKAALGSPQDVSEIVDVDADADADCHITMASCSKSTSMRHNSDSTSLRDNSESSSPLANPDSPMLLDFADSPSAADSIDSPSPTASIERPSPPVCVDSTSSPVSFERPSPPVCVDSTSSPASVDSPSPPAYIERSSPAASIDSPYPPASIEKPSPPASIDSTSPSAPASIASSSPPNSTVSTSPAPAASIGSSSPPNSTVSTSPAPAGSSDCTTTAASTVSTSSALAASSLSKRPAACSPSKRPAAFPRSKRPAAGYNLDAYLAERQLIQLVRKHPALYNRHHRRFKDDAHKESLWQSIASQLNLELSKCLSSWAELRYKYQLHVRRLRKFRRQAQSQARRAAKRPIMVHEEDLLFMFVHVARLPIKFDKIQHQPEQQQSSELHTQNTVAIIEDDDVTIVAPPPDVIIDLDVDYVDQYKISIDQLRLITAVRAYPQLYDTLHANYKNHHHRGLIWGAISNELREKATKLMKNWLHLQTRYEWETMRPSTNGSQIKEQLSFLLPHIKHTQRTVCKLSMYLQDSWYDPIENFRSVLCLINTLKGMPEVVQMVNDYQESSVKPFRYNELWLRVSAQVNCSNQRCEVTWLVLRNFYIELAEMRRAGYQLQDKWFFENIIASVYKSISVVRSGRRVQKRAISGEVKSPVRQPVPVKRIPEKPAQVTLPTIAPPLPLAIVYPALTKRPATETDPDISPNPTPQATLSLSTSPSRSPRIPSSNSTMHPDGYPLPRISAAIRVVKRPIVATPAADAISSAATATSYMDLLPNNLPLSIPATVQLASVPAMPRPDPVRTVSTGLQVVLRPKAVTLLTTPVGSVGTTIRPIAPQMPIATPMPKLINVASMLASHLGTTAASAAVPVPLTMPKLVPLTVRNDKISMPIHPKIYPTAAAAAAAAAATATAATFTTTPPPALLRKVPNQSPVLLMRKHQSALNSGWDDINSATATTSSSALIANFIDSNSRDSNSSSSSSISYISNINSSSSNINSSNINSSSSNISNISNINSSSSNINSSSSNINSSSSNINSSSSNISNINSSSSNINSSSSNINSSSSNINSSSSNIKSSSNISNISSSNISKRRKRSYISQYYNRSSSSSGSSSSGSDSPPLIYVEFRMCPTMGRLLHVHGTGKTTTTNLNMSRTAVFIREVLAIPQLSSKDPQLADRCDDLWYQMSKKFHMSDCICRAIWKFLSENINLFPQIAPMSDLMRPFKCSLKVWEKSHRLFSKFDEIARKYHWMTHKHKLPALMRHFEKYEHLYWELRRPRPGELPYVPQRLYTEKERHEVWRVARERFPQMNHRDVWSMFKFAFKTYMEDLERGIENPWPQNWWHALEQLKFLVNVRYHPLEPYYYIVHNKFMEEVKRCSMYEALMQPSSNSDNTTPQTNVPTTTNPPPILPWETEEAKRLLCGGHSAPISTSTEELQTQTLELQRANEADLLDSQQGVVELARHIRGNKRQLPNMDSHQLTRLLRCNPSTYGKATTVDKRSAWLRVAKELNSTVTECRLSLQYALREQRILKIRDVSSRCMLSHKYYRHMTEIYKQVRSGGHIIDRTPQQLHKALVEPRNNIYPESYIPEINMITCKPSLVVKNWAFAIGNLPVASQEDLRQILQKIFKKYEALVTPNQPTATATKRSSGELIQNEDEAELVLPDDGGIRPKQPKLETDA